MPDTLEQVDDLLGKGNFKATDTRVIEYVHVYEDGEPTVSPVGVCTCTNTSWAICAADALNSADKLEELGVDADMVDNLILKYDVRPCALCGWLFIRDDLVVTADDRIICEDCQAECEREG